MSKGLQKDAEAETGIQAACRELNDKLKTNPKTKPNISVAAHCHSINYTTLRNRFQGHTQRQNEAYACQQCISPEQENIIVSWLEHLGSTGHPICKCTIKHHIEVLCG